MEDTAVFPHLPDQKFRSVFKAANALTLISNSPLLYRHEVSLDGHFCVASDLGVNENVSEKTLIVASVCASSIYVFRGNN